MTALLARAPGKVNLCLLLGEPREDGLHPLVSVVQPVSLADELWLEPGPAGAAGDEVRCPDVPGPNLAGRALAAYREATGWDAPPQRLTIRKHVPVAAGMGGGSADAAAALRLAAHAAGRPGDPVLAGLAPALGADVPALLAPSRTFVTGAGEHVEPLPEPAPFGLLILPSRARLSTPAVFAEADRLRLGRRPEDLHALAHAVRETAGALPPDLRHNDLEAAARSLEPSIGVALAHAREVGAQDAMVSGSGPTVFGVFEGPDGPQRAHEAAARLMAGGVAAVAAEPAGAGFADPRPAEAA